MLEDVFLEPIATVGGYSTLLPAHVGPDSGWMPKSAFNCVGIDPGGTTGWCLMVVEKSAMLKADIKILESLAFWSAGEWTGPETRQARRAVELMNEWRAAGVIEDFILRQLAGGRDLLAPVRVTAGIETLLDGERFGVTRVVVKQPGSLAMTTMTDERLKAVGLYRPGQPHANDATRHVCTWLRRKKALLLQRR